MTKNKKFLIIIFIACLVGLIVYNSNEDTDYNSAEELYLAIQKGEDIIGKTVKLESVSVEPNERMEQIVISGSHTVFTNREVNDVESGDTVELTLEEAEDWFGIWIITFSEIRILNE